MLYQDPGFKNWYRHKIGFFKKTLVSDSLIGLELNWI